MDGSFRRLTARTLLLLLLLLLRPGGGDAQGVSGRRVEDFIRAVQQVEDASPGSEPAAVLKKLRRAAGLDDALVRRFLGGPESGDPELTSDLSDYIRTAVRHGVTEAREEGVVLTPDGSSVALAPLLLGLEAGFRSQTPGRAPGLLQLTLAKDLGEALGSSPSPRLGADGCWDNLTSPAVFTLSRPGSPLTAARVHGGMDGVVLGTDVSSRSAKPAKLSALLREYYCHQLDATGMDGAPRLIARRRRENFRTLVPPTLLTRQAARTDELRRRLSGRRAMEATEKKQLRAALREGVKEFVHMFMDCPPIIPRCTWGAAPYRGTPTNLSLPLDFLYIHHTSTPAQPCLSLQQCSADMRAMQRFHQDDRGWDDIGYSFVAGSDGNVYEGRGWTWRGAHTLGHNSLGYGVSFIGDYSARPPSQHAMALVRDRLASCAMGGGRLGAHYTLQGHRQLVDTLCPGDAFYQEIQRWDRFGSKKVEK